MSIVIDTGSQWVKSIKGNRKKTNIYRTK